MNNFQQIMLILATLDWDDGGPVFSDADLHDIEKHVRAMQAEIEQLRAARPSPDAGLVEALRKLLGYAERNECVHEETHREGVIWTVCDGCGKRGADDMGGFKPYQEPTEIAGARDAIARAEQARKKEQAT